MRKANYIFLTTLVGLCLESGASGQPGDYHEYPLTAEDQLEIMQIFYRYGHAIDTCANGGYDYADLYSSDGIFVDYFTDEGYAANGLVRGVGREALAQASGGGELGCENVGWKDWSHLMLNPVVWGTLEGAAGLVYSVVIGEKGPDHVQRFGGYEADFVSTTQGWRISKITHVRNKAWSHPLLQSEDLN